MRQIVLFFFLLPCLVFAQGNPNYNPDFDNNDCYTIMDVLSLLVILMPDDAGMESMNPNYDPDYDGDGVIDIGDLTHLLALFGNCEEAPACSSPSMDGYNYSVVQIGDQCWFAENLRTTTYLNGDVIPAGLTDGDWSSTTSGATAVYGEDDGCDNYSPDIDACDETQSLAEYGRLYNWYAVDDVRSLCPSGWHVPTDGEWTDLENHISSQGFSGTEGTALKSTYGWSNSGNGTDDFGFSALPGGFRTTTMATSTMPGAAATGGVLRPVAAMLGPGAWTATIQASTGTTAFHGTASRSGVLGMPITRRCKDVPTRPTLNLTRVPTLTTEAARRWLRRAIRLRWMATTTPWLRLATNAGLRRTCVRRCMLMARLYRKRPTILHGQG